MFSKSDYLHFRHLTCSPFSGIKSDLTFHKEFVLPLSWSCSPVWEGGPGGGHGAVHFPRTGAGHPAQFLPRPGLQVAEGARRVQGLAPPPRHPVEGATGPGGGGHSPAQSGGGEAVHLQVMRDQSGQVSCVLVGTRAKSDFHVTRYYARGPI
jgi:hypothetical protein